MLNWIDYWHRKRSQSYCCFRKGRLKCYLMHQKQACWCWLHQICCLCWYYCYWSYCQSLQTLYLSLPWRWMNRKGLHHSMSWHQRRADSSQRHFRCYLIRTLYSVDGQHVLVVDLVLGFLSVELPKTGQNFDFDA